MAKGLRWVLGGVAGVFLLLGAVLTYVVFVLDPNDYKAELARVVKDKTDMELALTGDLAWTLYPDIGIALGKTSLTDPVAGEQLLAVNQASVSVQLLPLLSQQVRIDAIALDGAAVRFVQHADGSTSWDRLLEKLKSPDEEESQQVALEIADLDVKNTQLTLVDEKAGVTRRVEQIAVQAQDIDPKDTFPVALQFRFSQKDAAGKTVSADSRLSSQVNFNAETSLLALSELALDSELAGTLLPAPLTLALKGQSLTADLNTQQHAVKGLVMDVAYRDPALTAPATLQLSTDVQADLAAQRITLPKLAVKASYQDKGRPAPVTADLSSAVSAALDSGELRLSGLVLNAMVADASLPKPMPVSLKAGIQANWLKGSVALSDLLLKAAGVSVSGTLGAQLPGVATGAASPLQGMQAQGRLQASPFNPRDVMKTLGITAPVTADARVLSRAGLSADISGSEREWLARNLRLTLDDSTFTGEAGVRELPAARLHARLQVDNFNADRYLPPPSAKTAAAPSASKDKPARQAVEELIPVALLRGQNLDVALSAGRLTILTYPIDGFRLAASARGGVVQVSELRGSIYSGSFSVPATVDVRGAKPVITIRPDIRQIDLGPIATAALNKDTFTGRMNFNGSVTMTGNDVDSWLRTAQGPNTLRLNDGLIKGVNVTDALFNALGQYQVLLPALTGRDVNTLKGKVRDTEIVSFLGETSLNQGVVSNNAMKADLKDVKVGGSGTYNLFTQDVDYRFQLRLDQRFWGEKYARMANYDIPVRCNGNLKASLVTLCALDRQGMQGLAAQMAQGRLNEELDRGKDRLQEKLGEKLDPQQQEAVKQIFDLFKR